MLDCILSVRGEEDLLQPRLGHGTQLTAWASIHDRTTMSEQWELRRHALQIVSTAANNGESTAAQQWWIRSSCRVVRPGMVVHAHVAAQSLHLPRVSGGQSPPGKFLNFPLSEVLSTAISGVCIRTCIWLLSASVTCYWTIALERLWNKVGEGHWRLWFC